MEDVEDLDTQDADAGVSKNTITPVQTMHLRKVSAQT